MAREEGDRVAGWTATVVAAAFVAVALLVAGRAAWLVDGVDAGVSRAVVGALAGAPAVLAVLRVVTWAGHPLVVDALVLAAAALLWRRRGPAPAIGLVGAGLASLLVREAVKTVLDRARPEPAFAAATGGSFPSGHTAGAAFVATAAAIMLRRAWVTTLAVAYATGIGATRVLLDVHWLSDVVGGALLGLAFGLLVPWATTTAARAGPLAARERTRPGR